jgi:hypothetical protein
MDAKKDSNQSIMPIVPEAGVGGEGGSQTGERSMQPRHSHHCRTNPLSLGVLSLSFSWAW